MRHVKTQRFSEAYEKLPASVQRSADQSYALLKTDPRHPSLHFKRLKSGGPYWSARIGIHHRAIAREIDGDFLWGWIGTHAEYDRVIKSL